MTGDDIIGFLKGEKSLRGDIGNGFVIGAMVQSFYRACWKGQIVNTYPDGRVLVRVLIDRHGNKIRKDMYKTIGTGWLRVLSV